jgi:hypothetical protein
MQGGEYPSNRVARCEVLGGRNGENVPPSGHFDALLCRIVDMDFREFSF